MRAESTAATARRSVWEGYRPLSPTPPPRRHQRKRWGFKFGGGDVHSGMKCPRKPGLCSIRADMLCAAGVPSRTPGTPATTCTLANAVPAFTTVWCNTVRLQITLLNDLWSNQIPQTNDDAQQRSLNQNSC